MKSAKLGKILKHGTLEQLVKVTRKWDLKPVEDEESGKLFITPDFPNGEEWRSEATETEKKKYQARLHNFAAVLNIHLIRAFDSFHPDLVGKTPVFVHGIFPEDDAEHGGMPHYFVEY